MAELKPCPFCGHRAQIILTGEGKSNDYATKLYKIECGYCGCCLHQGRSVLVKINYSPYNGAQADEEELKKLIEEWNVRADNDTERKAR